jgi:hypothetical protein
MGVVKKPTKSRKTIGERRREEESRILNIIQEVEKGNDGFKTFDIESSLFNDQPKFENGKEYYGITTDAFGRENDDGSRSLIIAAEVDNEDGEKGKFNKYFSFETEKGSLLHRFCVNMDAISPKGRIVSQALIGREVVVTLYTNNKGKTYISTIFPLDSDEDSVEDDYSYDNDFTYNDGEDGGCIYES